MASPMIFIGLGLMALMAMGGKKKGTKKGDDLDKLPPPPVEKEEDKTPEPAQVEQIVALLEDYRLPEGYSLPDLSADEWRRSLWVSDDCKAWALGKDFKATVLADYLPEFYGAYVEMAMGDDPVLAVVPPDDWVRFQVGEGTIGGYVEDPAKAGVARALLTYLGGRYAFCAEGLPEASDYQTGDEYLAAWEAYAQDEPNFYTLFYALWQYSKTLMEAMWEESYPDQAQEWVEREWAIDAAKEDASLEDRTDWAYHHAYPECPEVIDVNNPEHAECQAAYLRLRGYIQEYT